MYCKYNIIKILLPKLFNTFSIGFQVYAPYEESDESFHRSIFIFVCKNGSCCQSNNAENFVVIRNQLPRKNEYYSFEPYEEDENEVSICKL